MGAIWIPRNILIGNTGHLIGYKSGLGLTFEEFCDIMPNEFHEIWFGDKNDMLRVRAEEYEELIATLLYKLGNTKEPYNPLMSANYLKYQKDNPQVFSIFQDLFISFSEFLKDSVAQFATNRAKSNLINPTSFIEIADQKHGIVGRFIAIDIIERHIFQQHISPWNSLRIKEWMDVAELKDLFKSESLTTFYGKFIDQRYIDFLSHNFDSINNMNWRKFEALTCEFFDRNGYYVEIGEGRNDDGIDARVWSKEEHKSDPPTIIIQCKRQKSKIEKMVVKSLYADILDTNAKSGLIVTTSSLSPGAKNTCIARNYPIEEINRDNLKKWIKTMRTPYTGIFLS